MTTQLSGSLQDNRIPDSLDQTDSISVQEQRPLWRKLLRTTITLAGLGLFVVAFYLAIKVFLGPKDKFEVFSLPYEQTFDADQNVRSWPSKGGSWVQRNSTLAQTVNLADPVQIFLPYRLVAGQPYHASTYFAFSPKAQATGLSFNAQYPDLYIRQHLAFVSRTESGELTLVAGYTDETGGFLPQVQIPFDTEAQDYRLDVYVYSNTYSVELNGQKLIADRPLFYRDGMLGFFSVGPASYDSLQLTAATETAPDALVYRSDFGASGTAAGWVPFAGDWRIEDNGLVQTDVNAYDAGIGYEGGSFSMSVYEVTLEHLHGIGGGILFNMPSPYQLHGAQAVRFSEQADGLYWGYYDAAGVFVRQGFAEVPSAASSPHVLQIYAGESTYDIYLDGSIFARDIPAQASSGHLGLITSRSHVAFSRVEVYPLLGPRLAEIVQMSETFSTTASAAADRPEAGATDPSPDVAQPAPLEASVSAARPVSDTSVNAAVTTGAATPLTGDFSGQLAGSGWVALSPDWRFDDGRLVQPNPENFDQAVVYTPNQYRDYRFTASFSHVQGTGGGLLFSMPYADRLEGAHMVRYSEKRADAIFWGYYTADGRFIGQGYANVPDADSDRHTLTVETNESTYSIRLDDTLIAHSIPLQQNTGYLGLVTALSAVAYDSVGVSGNAGTPAGTYRSSSGFPDGIVVAGDWISEQNVITQTNDGDADFIYSTGIHGGSYTLTARLVLSGSTDAGAGVIFHMPERSQKQGASMVRLADGGRRVIWGSYDDTGAFMGKGSREIPSSFQYSVLNLALRNGEPTEQSSRTLDLRVEVAGSSFNLFIDDKPVAVDVKLKQQAGWIGLLTHGGPVAFEDVQITVGEIE